MGSRINGGDAGGFAPDEDPFGGDPFPQMGGSPVPF